MTWPVPSEKTKGWFLGRLLSNSVPSSSFPCGAQERGRWVLKEEEEGGGCQPPPKHTHTPADRWIPTNWHFWGSHCQKEAVSDG